MCTEHEKGSYTQSESSREPWTPHGRRPGSRVSAAKFASKKESTEARKIRSNLRLYSVYFDSTNRCIKITLLNISFISILEANFFYFVVLKSFNFNISLEHTFDPCCLAQVSRADKNTRF